MVGALGRSRAQPGEIAVVIGGAALLTGSWLAVTGAKTVPEREAEFFEAVNGLPNGLWPVIWAPMQLGSFGGSLAVVGGTALVTRDRRLTVAALAGSQAAFWAAKGVKRLVSRGRPAATLVGVRVRERATGLGYVSGHAAVACALAATLVPSLPWRWRPLVVAGVGTVGLGRMYAGAHLPLDVVGGAGLGMLTGTFARWSLGLGGAGLPPTGRH